MRHQGLRPRHNSVHQVESRAICRRAWRGIGEGASGIAAGLLHPFSPRGKTIWRGMDGYNATLRLLEVAENAQGASNESVCTRNGILRYAEDKKQAQGFDKNVGRPETTPSNSGAPTGLQVSCVSGTCAAKSKRTYSTSTCNATKLRIPCPVVGWVGCCETCIVWHPLRFSSGCCLRLHGAGSEAARLLPGFKVKGSTSSGPPSEESSADKDAPGDGTAGVHIQNGLAINARRYLDALWQACQVAADAGTRS
eukprot:499067-Prorocentrum_minimum.AAC.5